MSSNHLHFYTFRHNSSHTRGFPWAISIIPRSEMHYKTCIECGIVEKYPSGAFDVILEKGTKYPDILGCGAYPFLIVSNTVIQAWREASITCFHTYPVGITETKSKKLQSIPQPQYLRVEIDGRCEIDLEASGIEVIRVCSECKRVVTQPRLPNKSGYHMKANSWDGCPLFRDVLLYPRVQFCTDKIIKIASQHRFSNFRFEQMEGPFDNKSKGIPYLK